MIRILVSYTYHTVLWEGFQIDKVRRDGKTIQAESHAAQNPHATRFVTSPQLPKILTETISKKGFTQSGPIFRAKTGALQKSLHKTLPPHYSLSFSFPTGPHRLLPFDQPSSSFVLPSPLGQDRVTQPDDSAENYAWWRRTSDDPVVYDGMGEGFARIRETIRDQGPFDGVIGFSQGAAMAALVASALEEVDEALAAPSPRQRRELPTEFQLIDSESQLQMQNQTQKQGRLKFAIFYSGFRAADPRCDPFFTPKISTPTMHVLGALDSVVEESRTRALVACCSGEEGRGGEAGGDSAGVVVMIHPGGHFVPSQKVWLDRVTGFVRRCLDGEDKDMGIGGKDGGEEEKVEDMDVPF